MTAHSLHDGLVIVHEALTPISGEAVAEALAPAAFMPSTRTVTIAPSKLALDTLADEDWGAAHADLFAAFDSHVAPLLAHCAGEVHYLGMPPIPLGIALGRRIGPARRLVAHQQRHDTKSWRFPATTGSVTAELRGVPSNAVQAKGDVILRVSCSHVVEIEDARAVVPFAIGELSVEVAAPPHEDLLQSDADVMRVAAKVGEALDCVSRCYPNCGVVHVFAAVPPALAIRIGAEINPTIHRPVQTYQFAASARPRYRRALLVGERPRPALTDEQVRGAEYVRSAFSRALTTLDELGASGAEVPQCEPHDRVRDAVSVARSMGSLGANPVIVGARVSHDARDAAGEFRWAPDRREWILDDRLLCGLRGLAAGELERLGRLFFLHEGIHCAKQGVTSANAEGVGRLPRVLEEVDYLADVWALLAEHDRALHASEISPAESVKLLQEMLRLVTATFWAFDASSLPLQAIQVRRLNRFLIWYWQRLRLEHATSTAEVLRVLGSKPLLELSGPRVFTSHGRVFFDLDPAYTAGVELGVLVGGVRLQRFGSRAGARVAELLSAVRTGDEPGFMHALRGVFDSVDDAR